MMWLTFSGCAFMPFVCCCTSLSTKFRVLRHSLRSSKVHRAGWENQRFRRPRWLFLGLSDLTESVRHTEELNDRGWHPVLKVKSLREIGSGGWKDLVFCSLRGGVGRAHAKVVAA